MTKKSESEPSENPPLFKSWRGWYILVLASLVMMIILFYIFSKAFA